MSIAGMIQRFKASARQREHDKIVKEAKGLQELRKERIRLQGQQKVRDLVREEKAKIHAARYAERDRKIAKVREGIQSVKQWSEDRQKSRLTRAKRKSKIQTYLEKAERIQAKRNKADKDNPWKKEPENNPWR